MLPRIVAVYVLLLLSLLGCACFIMTWHPLAGAGCLICSALALFLSEERR